MVRLGTQGSASHYLWCICVVWGVAVAQGVNFFLLLLITLLGDMLYPTFSMYRGGHKGTAIVHPSNIELLQYIHLHYSSLELKRVILGFMLQVCCVYLEQLSVNVSHSPMLKHACSSAHG